MKRSALSVGEVEDAFAHGRLLLQGPVAQGGEDFIAGVGGVEFEGAGEGQGQGMRGGFQAGLLVVEQVAQFRAEGGVFAQAARLSSSFSVVSPGPQRDRCSIVSQRRSVSRIVAAVAGAGVPASQHVVTGNGFAVGR